MRRLLVISLMLTAAFTARAIQATEPALDELSHEDVPQWTLVSLKGLGGHLLKIHETRSAVFDGVKVSVDTSDVALEDFTKVRGTLSVYGKTKYDHLDTVHINFSACNGVMGQFTPLGEGLKYRSYGQTAIACSWPYNGKSGRTVSLITPMLIDRFFVELLPSITQYKVSADSQTLTLLDESGEQLGLFSRAEAAE